MIRVEPRTVREIRPPASPQRSWPAWTVACGFALAALFCVPLAIEAGKLLAADDDPVAITDRALPRAFDGRSRSARSRRR